jgi:hypothetical protein
LPTAKPSRGMHVFFRTREPVYRTLADGELRGTGKQYVLLPPSWHPDGLCYEWVTEPSPGPNGNLLLLDSTEAGLDCAWLGDGTPARPPRRTAPVRQEGGRMEHTRHQDSVFHSVDHLIARTQPTGERQRNTCLFTLARYLRGLPGYANADPRTLEPVVREWHRRCVAVVRTKDFAESFSDFRRGWASVARPLGGGAQDVALRDAIRDEPAVARRYSDSLLRLLVGICYHLQRFVGDGHFF